MHNIGVKPKLRKCYRKSYIYEVCLFSSVFTQLYSIIIILCIIALINFFFVQFEFNGAGVVLFSKMLTFARGFRPLQTCTNNGGGAGVSRKGQFSANVIIEWPQLTYILRKINLCLVGYV